MLYENGDLRFCAHKVPSSYADEIELRIDTHLNRSIAECCQALDGICREKGDYGDLVLYSNEAIDHIQLRAVVAGVDVRLINDHIPRDAIPDRAARFVRGYLRVIKACGEREEITYAQDLAEVLMDKASALPDRELPDNASPASIENVAKYFETKPLKQG